MLSVANRPTTMSAVTVDNPPDSVEEILEDGEIEDGDESEEEVVTVETETVVLAEQNGQNVDTSAKDISGSEKDPYYDSVTLKQSLGLAGDISQENDENDMEDDMSPMTAEERRRYKKHQRKRKRHKESREKEMRSLEKKERRRKRKMHGAEDRVDGDHEHGGSASPHGKRRRKRKKHTKDHKERDSTSPDSNASEDTLNLYAHRHHRGAENETEIMDYDDDYTDQQDPYTSPMIQSRHKSYSNASNNNTSNYYSPIDDPTTYQDEANYESNSESGSDFEAQLAEYKSYKTKKIHGDGDDDAEDNDDYYGQAGQYMSPSGGKRLQSRRRGQNIDSKSGQRMQRSKRSRWEQSSKMSTNENENSSRKERKDDRMSHQYEDYDSYSENPRRPCKFFAEGNCLKGNECTFSHDIDSQQSSYHLQPHRHSNKTRTKRRELCKYYLAGHCHHGDSCSYMHGDYPCKYYHTGATCYGGDSCRFSHAPATEETREIIDNLKDIYNNVDDSWEISELAKVGMKALSKPPPGVGLLPTPTMPPSNNQLGTKTSNIPSLFDIEVEPTPDFQRRIDENSVASLSMTDESEGTSEARPNRHRSYNMQYHTSGDGGPNVVLKTGVALLPTPVSVAPLKLPTGRQNVDGDDYYDDFYEGDHYVETSTMKGKDANGQAKQGKSDDEVIKTDDDDFIRIDSTNSATDGHSEDGQSEAADVKAPDFLPATQKALFMRIHHKRTSQDTDKDKGTDGWTYSSDDEEKAMNNDLGIIKMDNDPPATSSPAQASSASVESILKMITNKKGDISTKVDTNLLSKVASVINMASNPASTSEHYNPASGTITYNPAQVKASPRHSSSGQNTHHRERKTSGSSSGTSPGHSSGKHHHHPHPIRRRLSTQELSKEPTIIPLVAKQSGGAMHSAHPDPRLSLSRLIGVKMPCYTANLPRFSKDLILPGSGKMVGLKITLSTDDSKTAKRDPRLGRRKDPRLQKSSDPRLKNRNTARTANTGATTDTTPRESVPAKPSALFTKSSAAIPSLPELDLDLAHINNKTKDSGDSDSPLSSKTSASYSLPQHLKLPRLMKAPVSSPPDDNKERSPSKEPLTAPPTIAPYDPRYMSSGPNKSSGSNLSMNTAPYDPRVLSSHSTLPTGELKKRTIQLPKLTPAPSYKPAEDFADEFNTSVANEDKPEGDQGDF